MRPKAKTTKPRARRRAVTTARARRASKSSATASKLGGCPIVGVGGSATTDGGLGCIRALAPRARLAGVELVVACDVSTTFVDAAETFAPQKGASPAQVASDPIFFIRARIRGRGGS